jgi:hypothetical protein
VKRRLYIALGAALALAAAFVGGRYSRPVEVREVVKVETKTVTVTEWKDRIVEKRVEGPVRIRTVTREVPGGERVVTVVEERGPVVTDRASDAAGSTASRTTENVVSVRVVESARPGWRLSVAAGWDAEALSLRPELYGVEVSRRLVGTVWIGAWARTDRTGGLGLAMEW